MRFSTFTQPQSRSRYSISGRILGVYQQIMKRKLASRRKEKKHYWQKWQLASVPRPRQGAEKRYPARSHKPQFLENKWLKMKFLAAFKCKRGSTRRQRSSERKKDEKSRIFSPKKPVDSHSLRKKKISRRNYDDSRRENRFANCTFALYEQ